jgi:two-component system, OmpR family, phosphate regulon sensor histidine kinase PhoR
MQERGVSFKIKAKKSLDTIVLGDQNRIKQVMTNLVENAVKYGREKGNILISFTEEKRKLQVAIKDDGEGIAPEHLSRIFERFYRIDKSRSRETGGSGLGLAIVKHILSGHNSSITVSSQLGVGTTFSFNLDRGNNNKPKTRFEEMQED